MILAFTLLAFEASANECGHGPVAITVRHDSCKAPDKAPVKKPDGTYEAKYACHKSEQPRYEVWSDWPECGGKKVKDLHPGPDYSDYKFNGTTTLEINPDLKF